MRVYKSCIGPTYWLLYRPIWLILREAASCGPSALADILVASAGNSCEPVWCTCERVCHTPVLCQNDWTIIRLVFDCRSYHLLCWKGIRMTSKIRVLNSLWNFSSTSGHRKISPQLAVCHKQATASACCCQHLATTVHARGQLQNSGRGLPRSS